MTPRGARKRSRENHAHDDLFQHVEGRAIVSPRTERKLDQDRLDFQTGLPLPENPPILSRSKFLCYDNRFGCRKQRIVRFQDRLVHHSTGAKRLRREKARQHTLAGLARFGPISARVLALCARGRVAEAVNLPARISPSSAPAPAFSLSVSLISVNYPPPSSQLFGC